jgi:hypothetical protein
MAKFGEQARVCLEGAVSRLDGQMARADLAGRSVTLSAAVRNPAGSGVWSVNAGHPSPLVYHERGGPAEVPGPHENAQKGSALSEALGGGTPTTSRNRPPPRHAILTVSVRFSPDGQPVANPPMPSASTLTTGGSYGHGNRRKSNGSSISREKCPKFRRGHRCPTADGTGSRSSVL